LLSLIRAADIVFVQTQREGEELRRRGIEADKIVLQGLGVAFEECSGGVREATRRQWRVQPDDFVVGHLANQSREKGTVDLLLAAATLWQQGLPIRVVLAGPEMPNFQRFWRDFAVRFPRAPVLRLGVLSEPGKKAFYAGLDAFALPSRSDSLGLVLLEAWANGLPTLAYRAGGPAELVQHERDGLLVPCGDVEGLATCLAQLARAEELRHQLGSCGRERAAREFGWHAKLQLVHDVYMQIAGPAERRQRGSLVLGT
jgi:glycosyltransferase involved in cell wall biosynthesis